MLNYVQEHRASESDNLILERAILDKGGLSFTMNVDDAKAVIRTFEINYSSNSNKIGFPQRLMMFVGNIWNSSYGNTVRFILHMKPLNLELVICEESNNSEIQLYIGYKPGKENVQYVDQEKKSMDIVDFEKLDMLDAHDQIRSGQSIYITINVKHKSRLNKCFKRCYVLNSLLINRTRIKMVWYYIYALYVSIINVCLTSSHPNLEHALNVYMISLPYVKSIQGDSIGNDLFKVTLIAKLSPL